MMDLNTFQEKADIYGGDLSRWPKELLTAAVATLKATPDAQRLLDDALAFDAPFASLDVPPASSDLRARILAIPERTAIPAPIQWLLKPSRLAASVALCSFLGLFAGVNDVNSFSYDAVDGSAWILAPDQSISY